MERVDLIASFVVVVVVVKMSLFVIYFGQMWMHACHSTRVAVRGQLVGVGSPSPLCGSPGSDSGHQARQRASLPAESSRGPLIDFINLILYVFKFSGVWGLNEA